VTSISGPSAGADISGAAMALRLNCPGCDTALNVADTLIGKTIKCKTCGEMIPVTAPAKAAVARRATPVIDDEDDVPVKTRRRKWDDGDDDDAPTAVKSSGGSKGLMIAGIAVALLLLLGGGMAGAYFLFASSTDEVKTVAAAPGPDASVPIRQADTGTPTPPNETSSKPEPKKADETNATLSEKTPGKGEEQKASGSPPKQEDKPKPVEPVKPKADTQVPAAPSAGLTSDEYERKMMSGQLDGITLDQCKKSTVFVEVESKFGGGSTGSGWFGIENNIVITNAHVLGMLSPSSPPPAKITLFLNSGERGQTPGVMQREIPHQRIKIIAVDRFHDIAIMEISGEKDLPVPFKVRPTSKMRERQGITVLGFPHGYTPGAMTGTKKQPTISVRPSTATALRYDDFGILRNLQIEGGTNPGNSGGPQVDAEGYVIAMTVSGITRGGVPVQINFSVPTEHIQGLLAGRPDEVTVDTAFHKDGMVHIPIRITAQDPLKRLKSIGIGYWIGESTGGIRPPGDVRKGIVASDKDYKEVNLTYDAATKTASGTLILPSLTAGMTYWIQPFYSNAITPKYYLPGTKIVMKGPPVDVVPTNLQVNLRTGPVRPFTLVHSSARDEFFEGEDNSPDDIPKHIITMKGTETVIAPDNSDSQNAARLRLKYDDAEIKEEAGNQEGRLPPRIAAQIKQGIKSIEAYAFMNRSGMIYKTRTNSLAVQDPLIRLFGPLLSSNALEALTICSIPLPNREVQPGESWSTSVTVTHTISFMARLQKSAEEILPDPGQPGAGPRGRPGGAAASQALKKEFIYSSDVSYTYQGTRTRAGRKEAVIKVTGKITPASGQAKDSANGKTKGYAFVDVATGVVVDAEIETDFEIDTSIEGTKRRSYSQNKYVLTRGGNVR
jgi:S1-C subfamily serine protease